VASRKEQKAAARAERERREAETAAAERRRRLWIRVAALAIALPVIAVIAIALGGPLAGGGGSKSGLASYYPKESVPSAKRSLALAPAASAAGCKLLSHPGEGHNHTTSTVHYRTNPPSSGDHNPIPASDGAYTQAPGIGHLVHALEHGRVIIWFKPNTPPRLRGELKALVDQSPSLLVLTPDQTGMPSQVAASAWSGNLQHGGTVPEFGHVLGCSTVNPKVIDALRAFIAANRGHGPEYIPQAE
jgi:hypothetical protein